MDETPVVALLTIRAWWEEGVAESASCRDPDDL